MAPPFSLITLDGRHISLDGLAGKVVLIDFWATWCGPCREALPHIRQIAKKFDGQPLVVLSISLDSDEAKWKDFVGKNGMTWMQYREGGFEGSISKQFNATAIPATFTIDADGVLEDQHVGDADIEGKLKKLIAGATEAANRKATAEGLHSEKAASSSE
jgi:thiol-disulfide isomerase/thioredoxin